VAARAYANAEKGIAHAWSIQDRERYSTIFGLGNRALKAALETINFFAMTCEAPHREAVERPLYSRGRLSERPARRRR
jgi:hypothetical protein